MNWAILFEPWFTYVEEKKKNQEVEKNDLSTKYLILNANALPEVCYYPRLTLYFVLKPILISLQSYKYI